MVGGADAGFSAARAVFDAVGKTITLLGPAGSGQICKSANQLIIDAKINVGAFGQLGFNTDPINGASSIVDPPDPTERLTYTLLDHGAARFSKDVLPGIPFRLPSGYKTDVIAHQLVGNVRVKYIKVAESMLGLKAV